MTAQRRGIDNTPGAGEIKSLGDLCYEVLEPLRAHFDKPVTITSGYRAKLYVKLSAAKRHRSMPRGRPST
jgi:zinc D-Ala-D-Ala carboxypeptidase